MFDKIKSKLVGDDRAVSPVIGVILMVAITVILAAVIASMTLGLGDSAQTAPTAQLQLSQDGSDVTLYHEGGDDLSADSVVLRYDGEEYDVTEDLSTGSEITVGEGDFGDSGVTFDGGTLTVVWQNDGSSQPLATIDIEAASP